MTLECYKGLKCKLYEGCQFKVSGTDVIYIADTDGFT